MIINPVSTKKENGKVRVESLIEYAGKKEVLWYAVEEKYEQYLTTNRLDAFLVGSLLLGMRTGEDIVVRGAISEKLYYNLKNYYMSMVSCILPFAKHVNVAVEMLDNGYDSECLNAVVTGFSGGIDSFCTISDHLSGEVPPGYRITHFLFNNVGAFTDRLFCKRYELVKPFARELGLEFVTVDSNLNQVLQLDFDKTHEPRNMSCVLLLQKLFGKYYYASAYSYRDARIGGADDMAYADAAAMHLLSTESLECISSGGQYSRTEKTRRVAKLESARRFLNVCTSPVSDVNCSTCWKCCRTLFTLELLGELEKFDAVFDLEKWRRVKRWYIADTVLNFKKRKDPLTLEVRQLAEDVGYRFSVYERLFSLLVSVVPGSVYRRIRNT